MLLPDRTDRVAQFVRSYAGDRDGWTRVGGAPGTVPERGVAAPETARFLSVVPRLPG